ncbi:15223_t:CDS:1, partial [Funneliformis geosporum]
DQKLQALQENLSPEKWQQIKKMAIIGQDLAFKYKKWITNKQLLD